MGTLIPNPPKIFHVNWFRTDDEGNFIWPGFGDNMRVLMWILARCEGKVEADITPIGYVPHAEDINIEGLEGITVDTIRELLSVDKASWLEDIANIKEFYAQVGDRVPNAMYDELAALEKKEAELSERVKTIMMTIPNIIDPSVPIGKDDSENVEVQRYGEPVVPDFEIPYHTEIMEKFDGIDLDSARKVAGNGFYYLMGDIARLHSGTQYLPRCDSTDQIRLVPLPTDNQALETGCLNGWTSIQTTGLKICFS